MKKFKITRIEDFFKGTNKKTKEQKNYRSDETLKYIFSKIDGKRLIKLFNYYANTNFDENAEVVLRTTEFVGVTGTLKKRSIRGDSAFEVKDENHKEGTNIIVIEYQSDKDSKMPFRLHAYGYNHHKNVKTKVKTIVNGEEVMVEKVVSIAPHELLIYTTLKEKEKIGFIEHNMSYPEYKTNGVECSVKNGDVITREYMFVNILRMKLDELNDSPLDFLQGIYMYKYLLDPDLILSEDFGNSMITIRENLTKFEKEDFDLANTGFMNIVYDLTNLMKKDKVKYKKELEIMDYMENTYAGNLLIKSKATGIEIGKATVVKTFLKKLPVEEVAKIMNIPIEEVTRISQIQTTD